MKQFEYYAKASKYTKALWLEMTRIPANEHIRYHGTRYWTFAGDLDIIRLQNALQAVVNNNWDMRSNFFEHNGEIYLGVRRVVDVKLEYREVGSAQECSLYIEKMAALPFDFERDLLVRCAAIKNMADQQTTLLFVFCHLNTDGAVTENFARQVEQAYVNNEKPTPEGSDSAGLEVLKAYMSAEAEDAADNTGIAYWVSRLSGRTMTNQLPRESGSRKLDFKVIQASRMIKGEVYKKIKGFCEANKVSLFNFMQALTGILVCRYSGFGEAVIAYPVSLRGPYKALKGFCVNQLPYVFEEKGTFAEQVRKLHEEIPPRSARKVAAWELNGTVYSKGNHINVALTNSLSNKFDFARIGSIIENMWVPNVTQCDLVVSYAELADGIDITVLSVAGVLSRESLEQIAGHLVWLAENHQMLQHGDSIVTDEQIKMLDRFNQTHKEYPNPCGTIVEMFKQTVSRVPDRIAVVYEERKYTYQELDDITEKLAKHLKPLGVGAEQVVGVLIDRSEYMVIYPLAILKAGGAYMPLDYSFPSDRLEFMLKDAGVKLILSEQNKVEEHIPQFDGRVIKIDDISGMAVDEDIALPVPTPHDMFVILYTSGSTGTPKGCILEHHNMVNYCKWYQSYYHVTERDRSPAYANFGFDAHMLDIYPFITCGASTYVIPSDMRLDFIRLNRYFEDNQISIAFMTTQLGRHFVEQLDNKSLRTLMIGGEKLLPIKKPSYDFYNVYGPTECTLFTTSHVIKQDYDSSLIGKPLDNYQLYVLDAGLQLVPPGVAGELCVGGAGVGRGYLNRDDVTAEKFILWQGKRIYRTGDLVRWTLDGEIEYIGRMDGQVKLRGLRIELGEIEAQILSYEGITSCAVAVKEIGGTEHLCGYYTAETEVDQEKIKQQLATKLTAFMIPTAFTRLDAIPLTSNGKVNRKALPDPVIERQEIVSPQNETQQQLFDIIAGILTTRDFGITDDFFSVGLTSILAIKLSVDIYKQFGVNVKTSDIFKNKTIEQLEQLVNNTSREEETTTFVKQEYYPLTENQLGLYYEWEKDRTALQYNIPQVSKFSNQVDPSKLKVAVEKVIEAHPYIKTCLGMKDGQVVQLRRDDEPVYIKLAEVSDADILRIKETFVKPFDLFQEPLYRIAVYHTQQHTYLFTDIHHIIIDGSALGVFMADVVKAYNGEEVTQEIYTAFEHALEEEQLIGSERYLAAEKYFDEKLKNGMIELPKIAASGGEKQSAFVAVPVPVSGESINSFCLKNAVTPANLFLSAVCMTLHRYTREEQIAITAISSGRNETKLNGIMGMMVKTLPVAVSIRPDENTLDYVKAVQNNMLETLSHEIYPFTKMVEKHKIVPQINYAYQGGMLEQIMLEGQAAEMEGLALEKVKFPLVVFAMPKLNGYEFKIEYDNSLYTKDYIETLCSAIAECVGKIAESPKMLCKDICIVNDGQLKVLEKFNQTHAEYPNSCGSIVEMFRQQAEKMPDNIAVVYEERKYTYQELDDITDKLAKHLKTMGVGAEQVVGVLIDRSEYMVIYPLAVLKAGGAYMPLDYSFPSDRLEFMLKDAGVKLILSEQNKVEEHIPQFGGRIIKADDISMMAVDESIPLPVPAPNDMFVILYTSGSTGMPKGCILEHHNLVNYCKWYQSYYHVTERDRSPAYANFGFDAHMLDIYPFITCGASTYVIPSDMRLDFIRLNRYFEDNQISIAFMTTQLGRHFVEQLDNKSLRTLMIGGEKLLPIKKPSYDFYNVYGPTECTLFTTSHVIKQDYDSSIIGKPLDNYQLYVLDAGLQLVPPGVAGELCVGGAGVGRGYLNRDDVTAEKFILWQGKRIYRTGDLVRWTPDGEIEYIGRMDGQVKLRGLRIELGEIEAQILSYEGITSCAVAVKEIGGTEHLCGYYTAETEIDQEKLKQQLATKLTTFMIPTAFTQLDTLPLTSNGKVNRKALPDPVIERQEIVSPQNETQQQLFDIIAGILTTRDFGITDDFFSVGLTSIMAIKLSVDIYKQFGVNVKTSDIFKNKTIEQLEQLVNNTSREEETTTFAKQEYYPLTENQLGLYYEWEKDRTALQYNIPQVSKFSNQVDPSKLKAAVEKVIEAHSYLKTCLGMKDGQVVQLRRDDKPVYIELAEVSDADIASIKEIFVKPFDLFQEPLYRIAVYHTEQHTYLFTDIHHIIIDGSALGVFMADVVKAYNDEELTQEIYTAFEHALEEERLIGSERYHAAEKYFDDKLKNGMTELPRVMASGEEKQDAFVAVPVSGECINSFCQKNAVTPGNLFLSAVCMTLHRYTREEQIAITAISSGRSENKLNGIMGMLVKTLPVVVPIRSDETTVDYVKAVQDNMLETLSHEIYPFTKMVEKHKIAPLINYAYQGGMEESFELEGKPAETEVLALNKAKFPLAITAIPNNGDYEISIEYDDSLYTKDYIKIFTSAIAECAKQMAKQSQLLCKAIPIIDDEQQALLQSFNPAYEEFAEKTWHEVFEKTVKVSSGYTALIAGDKTLSYAELNASANKIAHALITKGIRPEDKVAFLLPRDSRLICTMLGIIKSGGAFIPVDPEYPADRINHVLEDSGAKFIITTKKNQAELNFSNGLVVDELLLQEADHNPVTDVTADNLCYIIYTSGSTGKPKGVMLEHHNIVNYVLPLPSNFYINKYCSCRVSLSITTVAFDVFLEETLVTLANGLTLAFADEETVRNPMLLAKFMLATQAEVMAITPSLVMQYLEAEDFAKALANVKVIICGGEKFPANCFSYLRKYTDAVIYNCYGPTETTIGSNAKELENEQVTVGKGLANVKLYIVDRDLNLLPIGAVGELLIGGRGVGRGYLNRPDLTQEMFILFQGERVYRSGDYAKWTTGGEVDIINRMDNQIKLRGLRIELGEIESRMNEYNGITASVVIIRKLQNAEYLCAYFTAKGKVNSSDLRDYLAQKLTAYMIPSSFTQLGKMPVTANGKTDLKALPEPVIQRQEMVPPQNGTQQQLFDITAGILGTEDFGITDDLFSVGLTSILAIKLAVAIHKQFHITIKTNDIFRNKTIAKLEEILSNTAQEEAVQTFDKREYYPLTANQLGLYYEWEKDRNALQYNIPEVSRFSCQVDPHKLKTAVKQVIEAHSYLKTCLGMKDGQVVQLRHDDEPVCIELAKLSDADIPNIKKTFVKPFDLFNGPLYRIAVYYTDQHTYLFTDIHHIIIDGSALGVFMGDVVKAYQGEALIPESYTAFEHALEEEQLIGSDKYKEAESFFDAKLVGGMTELPRVAKGGGENRSNRVAVSVPSSGINSFCQINAVTPNSLFLAALCTTLSRYIREERIAIAAISSGRNENKLHNIMGMLVKTVPVVVEVKAKEKTADYVKAVQDNMFEALNHDSYPFTKIAEKHGIVPQISYAYQGGMEEGFELAGEMAETKALALNKAKFPLSIAASPCNGDYEIHIEYDESLYTQEYMETLGRAIAECANNMAENSEQRCETLAIIPEEDKVKILSQFQGRVLDYDKNATFIDLFRKQAQIHAGHIALVDAVSSLSYELADVYSECLARELVRLGVTKNTFVGIMLPRRREFMISVIAAMKAGGAYVPLDNEYPLERIEYMLQDSGAAVLITTKDIYESKGLQVDNVILIDEFEFGEERNQDIRLAAPERENLAYMIYTSGSTGKPKGVMIRHKSLSAFLAWRAKDYGLTAADNVCCHSSFSFDASVYDLFVPLTLGGQLHIVSEDMRQDMQALHRYLIAHNITDGAFSTQLGTELINQFDVPLKSITLGGEKLKAVKKISGTLVNGYGPTEFTISSSYHIVDQDKEYDNIPIGKPVANAWSYVVDETMNLLPIGVAGELCLAGEQIALGYWNRAELTAEKFIDNPFKTCEENAKMYRTGDLVRWNANGDLEYAGRIDNQIKLRGFRIELGEIESAMAKFLGITASVADIKTIGAVQHLCGYFTADSDIDTSQLREHLRQGLTEYMVPTALLQLDKIPLTPNGKVDKKALPVPELQNLNEYVAPTNELEAKLCQIFAETLQMDQVGITDSFFELGGTSLLVMKVVVKAMAMDIGLTYGNVFAYQTPQKLAEFVSSSVKEASIIDTGTYDYSTIDQLLVKNSLGEITENPLGDILLTGATGFLGIHVLREFLDNYPGKVYCLMRSQDGNSADMRLKVRLVYYFDNDYSELFGNRIFTLEGDITEPESITVKVDTVINCAAMVKHFAVGNELEKVNVDGVRNLIQYCREQDAMLIQISTSSVAGVADASMKDVKMKESQLYIGQIIDNKYVHSKYLAERYVLEAAALGLKAKIMRVGNLMARSQDGEFQLNFQGNSFMNSLKSYKLLGKFPVTRMGGEAEFSPIDSTAKAVLKLAQSNSEYTVFHPYNNHAVYMADVIYAMKEYGFSIEVVSEKEFEHCLREKMQDETIMSALTGILAYQENDTEKPVYGVGSTNQFTTEVLYRLNFVWPVTSEFYIKMAIEALDSLGFFDVLFKPE
ncbi:non-ribosomal peptide synthetase [Sporomusa malonica]|uniref:Amino acid adenylation domain-containing protein/thioester reductase domain-containing protein n=1 Tax=Sporomusa malonica TaxID=112901 RepID=A0A1W2CP19_9FIRM|nr:non-ribosomal peptide synthetase [Sporomusa malonica]SMC86734.1 amino acid adenylation domain-containing protein/thioester reductase domain-containing protein [Sporomusa malonica]